MPGGKHANMQAWAPEEDQVILDMVQQEGPKWSRIVQQLPGRTVSSVRNRWQRIEKGRKLREAGVESKNRCHACGEPKRGHICYQKLRGGPQVDLRNAMGSASNIRRMNPDALRIAHQLAPPSVASQLHSLPSSHPLSQRSQRPQMQLQQHTHGGGNLSLKGMPPPRPPPPRRTRSQSLIDLAAAAGVGSNSGANGGYCAQGGGSSLFPPPDNAGAYNHQLGLTVDVAAAQPFPHLERSNTSFFNSLSQDDAFSPLTRELFESWAESPRQNQLPPNVAALLSNPDAPPALKQAASGQRSGPIKLTRAVSGFFAQAATAENSPNTSLGAAASLPTGGMVGLPPLSSFPGPAPASAAAYGNGNRQASHPDPMMRSHSLTAADLKLDMLPMEDGSFCGLAGAPHDSFSTSPRGGSGGRPQLQRRRSSRLSLSAFLEDID